MHQSPYVYDINVAETYCKGCYAMYKVDVLGLTRFSNNTVPFTYAIRLRYSDMLDFHQEITNKLLSLNKDATIPEFPPKKFFNNLSHEFLEERRIKLQLYFTTVLKSYRDVLQTELVNFCTPIKLNIIICGIIKSGKSLYLSSLASLLKCNTKPENSSPKNARKGSDYPYESLKLVSSNSVDVTLPPFISKLSDYNYDFPIDYTYNEFLYRIDVEKHTIKDMNEERCLNLLTKWAENGTCVIICINLADYSSYLNGIALLGTYMKIIPKKVKPIFVVVGMLLPMMKPQVHSEQIKDYMIKPPLNAYPTSYIEVDTVSGQGILKAMQILIKAKEKKDSTCA